MVRRRLVLIIVCCGALLDFGVFGIQGYQIHLLNNQQAQLNRVTEKSRCWAHVLDAALQEMPRPHTDAQADLDQQAARCRTRPG